MHIIIMYCTSKCYVACLHGDHVYNEASLCIVLSSGHAALISSQDYVGPHNNS